MDAEARALFERSIRKAVQDHTGQALDAALGELGWSDAMAIEPRAAISIFFRLQGQSNVSSSALAQVLRFGLGLSDKPVMGVVLPAMGEWDPPGRLDGHGLAVNGLAPAAARAQESAVVVASTERGALAVEVPTTSLTFAPVRGIDPDVDFVRVSAAGIGTFTDLAPTAQDWSSAVALARLALAHELVGACRTMLELAREHALGRVQFDRPISSFQAIRHRLADTLVAIEMADAMIDAAWLDGTPGSAAMAKAVAGRQARTTTRHCQQVLAGIGFTTEHPLHLSIRRTLVLDGLFGSAVSLTRTMGEEMVRAARLPPLLPL